MNKSKIEWCDHTMNFITGCRHECPYCYARRITLRFGGDIRQNLKDTDQFTKTENGLYVLEKPFRDENGSTVNYPFGFEPTLHKYRLQRLDKLGEGKNIFAGAMTDMFGEWVPSDWIRLVMDECLKHPQHNYLFLTKNPGRYSKEDLPEGSHFWYGTSVTKTAEIDRIDDLPKLRRKFASFEPILERIFIGPEDMMNLNWIILGAETGNRKGKVAPKAEWVFELAATADLLGIPVFMKDSLIPVVGKENIRREYPEELLVHQRSAKVDQRLTNKCLICRKKMDRKDMATLIAKVGKTGTMKTLCTMCRPCYEKWCRQQGIDGYAEEVFSKQRTGRRKETIENAKKEKLQKDDR